ncbi:MAG: hypothetical protein U0350_30420 [Caldilineaceae bacterium]
MTSLSITPNIATSQPLPTTTTQRLWLIGILGAGLGLRVFGALHPVEVLLDKTLPDDAFYYFQIAHNIVLGKGVTFDGLAPTNGFHPLWMLLTTLVFQFFSGDNAVRATLVLSSCLDMLAVWLLYRAVKYLTGQPEAGILAALIYALNPTIWMFALNGLETALNMAIVAILTERLIVWRIQSQLTHKEAALLGLLFGLALLARTDNIFLLVVSALVILLMWRQLTVWRRLQVLGIASAITVLVTAPWFLWNYFTFGSLVQVSGTILPYIQHQMFIHRTGLAPLAWSNLPYILYVHIYDDIVNIFIWAGYGRLSNTDGSILPVTLFITLCTAFIWYSPISRQEFFSQLKTIVFLPVTLFLLFLYHSGIRWVYREWYILPISWTILLILGMVYALVLNFADGRSQNKQAMHRLIWTLLCVALFVRSMNVWRIGIYPNQSSFTVLVQAIDKLPEGTRVGVADSGYVGFRVKRSIVNLDGVVNNQAANAMFAHQLMDYLLKTHVDYIYTESRYMIPELFGADFQNRLVEVPGTGAYRVILSGQNTNK